MHQDFYQGCRIRSQIIKNDQIIFWSSSANIIFINKFFNLIQNHKGQFTYDVRQKNEILDPPSPSVTKFSNKKKSFVWRCHTAPLNVGRHKWTTAKYIPEISILLGDPEDEDAYRATFRNIEAFGVSNISLAKVRSDIDTYQFQLTYEIPRIRVRSNFESSGVL